MASAHLLIAPQTTRVRVQFSLAVEKNREKKGLFAQWWPIFYSSSLAELCAPKFPWLLKFDASRLFYIKAQKTGCSAFQILHLERKNFDTLCRDKMHMLSYYFSRVPPSCIWPVLPYGKGFVSPAFSLLVSNFLSDKVLASAECLLPSFPCFCWVFPCREVFKAQTAGEFLILSELKVHFSKFLVPTCLMACWHLQFTHALKPLLPLFCILHFSMSFCWQFNFLFSTKVCLKWPIFFSLLSCRVGFLPTEVIEPSPSFILQFQVRHAWVW